MLSKQNFILDTQKLDKWFSLGKCQTQTLPLYCLRGINIRSLQKMSRMLQGPVRVSFTQVDLTLFTW